MLVCLTCWEVLDGEVMNRASTEQIWCPKKKCLQEVVDIDECLIPAIKELNERGYFTLSCCSGHYWEALPDSSFPPNTYILFDDIVQPEDLPDLPSGFIIEPQKGRSHLSIRQSYDIEDPNDLHIAILKAAIELTTWARGLDALPER